MWDSFDDIQAGEEVAVQWVGYDWNVMTVERVTKTQFLVRGQRFRKVDGRMVGSDTWSQKYARRMTDDMRETIRMQEQKIETQKQLREIRNATAKLLEHPSSVDLDLVGHVYELLNREVQRLYGGKE